MIWSIQVGDFLQVADHLHVGLPKHVAEAHVGLPAHVSVPHVLAPAHVAWPGSVGPHTAWSQVEVPGHVTVLWQVATPKQVWYPEHVACVPHVDIVTAHVVVPGQVGTPGHVLRFRHVATSSHVGVP